jgi:hypothetical protein
VRRNNDVITHDPLRMHEDVIVLEEVICILHSKCLHRMWNKEFLCPPKRKGTEVRQSV